MRKRIFSWFIAILSLQQVHGHGRLEDPPARNAAWRYGFNVPVNYDDVGLNCGGLSIQKANDGRCGICGDSYSGPRDHEIGGKYATNTIVRNYISGSQVDVKILLTANHVGFMELRLCPLDDPNREATQECLDENLLFIESFGTHYPVNEGTDTILLKVHLPAGLSCSHCVLQWRYHAGNNWGTDGTTGRSCLGCGYQEEFYNCADISIAPVDGDFLAGLSTSSPTEQSIFVAPFVDPILIPPEIEQASILSNEFFITATTPTTTTTTTAAAAVEPSMNFLFPYQPSEDLITQTTKSNKTLRCFPTHEVLKPLVGIEHWCLQLCVVHCPPTLCACVEL
ncbi:unnamed protein product [Adineta ricciae]|uniref:Chitin-binding type-4 domain-containing protein n=1 Tax=Adineta ricciae TaxID=249248 RepID=A0A816DLF3_ADIRI|nr:unnamed protein product [Adineta ricciae]CAF1638715.1 unnamed protein product [Adineta ricciae]